MKTEHKKSFWNGKIEKMKVKIIEQETEDSSGVERRKGQWWLALVIIFVGFLILMAFVKMRRPVKSVESETLAPLVKVQQLKVEDIQMVISGYGTVSPKVEVGIVPQVSGKVVWVNPQFKAGGFISAGEPVLKIDRRDYELAVQQAQAAVAEAQVKLDMETAEAEVAVKEWQQLHPGSEPGSSLVLREPQIRQAQAVLESGKAKLAKAQLDLERTELFLPIDVRVSSESVDLGQYVMMGQSAGSAFGIEAVEIELPLEDRELAWFDVPDDTQGSGNPGGKRTVAVVTAEFAGKEHVWDGYVVRTTGQVDKKSRLVTVVIEVPEPFETSGGRAALLPGTFVSIKIQGKVLKNTVAVPRDAVRSGREVWVVEGGKIYIKDLGIVRKDRDYIYCNSSLDDGSLIVVSSLDVVTDGMQIRLGTEPGVAMELSNDTEEDSAAKEDK